MYALENDAAKQRRAPDSPYATRRTDHLEPLPRREPVVRQEWRPDAPLTRAQYDAFERDGFLVLDSVFGREEVAALLAEIEKARFDPETIVREPESEALRSVFSVHTQNTLYARLARDARIAEIARFLLGDDVYIHQSRLNLKPGLRGKGFFWHSDFETWHSEDGMPSMRCLSASVLLTENTTYNGPLMLIPGSHKLFIPCEGETPENHYRMSLRRQEVGVPDGKVITTLFNKHGIALATGQAGSVLLFDSNVLHGSNSNITPLPRTNFFCVYNAVSNRLKAPFYAKTPRPEFIGARSACDPVTPVSGSILNS